MCDTRGRFIWSKDAVLGLINLYQNHPLLYNIQDPDYKNKVKREAAISAIKLELLKLPVCRAQCLSEDDIKNKIHTLRSQFNKEYKKRMDSLRTGAGSQEVYVPSLWCFEQLLFLKDIDEASHSISNLDNVIPETSEVRPETTEEDVQMGEHEIIFDGPIEELDTDLLSPSSSRQSSRSKVPIQKEVASLISTATTALQEAKGSKDDISAFSRSMEAELRKIKGKNRLRRLKRSIMNSIFEAQEEEAEGSD